jgi:tetratricopeptide (TPR) repeat protein
VSRNPAVQRKLDGLMLRAVQARRAKHWDELERYGHEMLALDPTSCYAMYLVAAALEHKADVESAIEWYERAMSIDMATMQGHYTHFERLDILYQRTKRYEDSLRVCRANSQRHPDWWDPWNRLRRAAAKAGDAVTSATAEKRAAEIRQQLNLAKEARAARSRKWYELYQKRLQELGIPAGERACEHDVDGNSTPMPPLDASGVAWGQWLQATTDMDALDARQQAMLDAWAQLDEEERANGSD